MGMSAQMFIITLLIYVSLTLSFTQCAPESALITQVPGFSGVLPSKHYSGYVTISEKQGKKLFYYFVVSERNPSEDPVVLWLNGGPGCSSMDGFVYEHGPFNFEKVQPRGSMPKLHLNKYSWSKVSNIIYLDSPAGVGYSYSENTSYYITTDRKVAFDSHIFLLKWFKLYPEFLKNPFYITGESYAGVYVPTLASEVVKGIIRKVKPVINFKGYMIGNGVTSSDFDENAMLPFAHGMALISDDLYQEVVAKCNGTYFGDLNDACHEAITKVDSDLDDLNVYNILEPCYHGPDDNNIITERLPESFRELGKTERPLPVRKRMFGRAWPLRLHVRDGIIPSWPQIMENGAVPCTDDEVATAWLNHEAVRDALHAEKESVIGKWTLCTNLGYTYNGGDIIGYHKHFTSMGYRALIYSGDHDMCVPYTGSEAWTRSVGYKIVDEWRPWYTDDNQVAGYIQGYDKNLTFLTIKGAGHTVPEYKPKESLAFYSRWLDGKKI